MALIQCGDADVLLLRLHLPSRGVWWSELILDTAKPPTGKVTIAAAGGFSLKGTIVQPSGVDAIDRTHVQVRGGAAGLGVLMAPASYRQAQLSDVLDAVLRASGETLSSTVDVSIRNVVLQRWTITARAASIAIDELCFAAGAQLGQDVNWRILDDGTLWLGVETWPAASLALGDDVLEPFPAEGRYVIGATSPSLLPGVNLDGVGKVRAVDHWVTPESVRSWAWV